MVDNYCDFTDSNESIGIRNLSLRAGPNLLIQNGNFGLCKEKKYAILGKNGCGKTTLLQYIHTLLGGVYIDQYINKDQWTDQNIVNAILHSDKEVSELLNYTPDNVEDLKNHQDKLNSLEIDKQISQIKRILNGLGFNSKDFERTYYDFSGGYKTKINIARALFKNPRIMFLDEPTNHLDLGAICWLEEYLKNYKGILLFVSHNLSFINEISTDIFHINNQKIQHYHGNYKKFCKQKDSEIKKNKIEWDRYQKTLQNLKSKGKQKEAKDLEKKIKDQGIVKPEKPYRIVMDFECDQKAKSPYICLQDVSFSYSDFLIFKDINLTIEKGSKIAILGKNGTGKTTFLKLLMKDLIPTQGNVLINENVIMSYFNQHSIENLPQNITPIEYLKNNYPHMDEQDIRSYLGKIALESTSHKKLISNLSGGQKMRIVFSEIIIKKPHLLLLDEPTNHLDIETIEALIMAINEYTENNGSLIVISHDINLIEETDCTLFLLEDQQLHILKNGIDEYIQKSLETVL